MGGQPPYQGDPYRAPGDKPSGPGPGDGGGRPPKRGNRHVVRNILGCVGILAVIGLVASALSSGGTGASTAATRASTPAVSPARSATAHATASTASSTIPQPTGPGTVGSSFNVQDDSGDTYQVTLVKVIDPAKSADQFITIGRGDRLVGIVFRITALAGSPQGEDANLDATAVGSDGQAYKAVFDRIVGYTNFEVGVIHAAQGEMVIGAVTFQLPQYVKVVEVRWAASDGLGSTVTWSGGS